MEEIYLGILKKHELKTFGVIAEGQYPELAKALAKINREWTEWIGFESSRIIYREIDSKWLYVKDLSKINEWTEFTFDDLFRYWWENIYSKKQS